ncbi:MAG: hypothetical protein R2799_10115 [Crocinitomicaceae bacterium]
MKKIVLSVLLVTAGVVTGYGQEIAPMKKVVTNPADTSSFAILENPNHVDVYNDLKIRQKISFYRKKTEDFILEFEDGLKILIYKEEE